MAAKFVRQLRTKKKLNNRIGPGVMFTVQSVYSSGKPTDPEIREALESQFGKGAELFSAFTNEKYEILA